MVQEANFEINSFSYLQLQILWQMYSEFCQKILRQVNLHHAKLIVKQFVQAFIVCNFFQNIFKMDVYVAKLDKVIK